MQGTELAAHQDRPLSAIPMFWPFGIYTRRLPQQSRTLGETGNSEAHDEHIIVVFSLFSSVTYYDR